MYAGSTVSLVVAAPKKIESCKYTKQLGIRSALCFDLNTADISLSAAAQLLT